MARKPKRQAFTSAAQEREIHSCSLPPIPPRQLAPDINPFRAQLIRVSDRKWVNGTVLHYYFFDKPKDGKRVGPNAQRDVVRKAFKAWKDLGLGLEFSEVDDREDAEIRIGFDQADGSWSYVGRDVIDQEPDPNEATMNFGWDLTTDYGWDTALHEIGHTLGFPHEHQNPNAGIVWNEPEVLKYFRGSPNFWKDATIKHNILDKLPLGSVSGSDWDPNSIMHYEFPKGLIDLPEKYRAGLRPAGGLSAVDIKEAKAFYPALGKAKDPELVPFKSQTLKLAAGQQANFAIRPERTRKYTIQTFGVSDSVMVLFDNSGKEPRYLAGDDDSGDDRNARIQVKLQRGREYVLRIRLYFSEMAGEMALLLW